MQTPRKVLYDWDSSRRTTDWKLEGNGEVLLADDGALQLRTYQLSPHRKATTVWLKNLVLPENFCVEWTFRSSARAGNSMFIFNALPVGLKHLFEDTRPDARYCDLASYGKIISHTLGFHRGVYGRPSVLRKLGGNVPMEWHRVEWDGPWKDTFDRQSTLSSTAEPLRPDDLGKVHSYRVEHEGRRIRAWLGETLLHDFTDDGRYPHFPAPLKGGHMAFRNFGGYADDFFSTVRVSSL